MATQGFFLTPSPTSPPPLSLPLEVEVMRGIWTREKHSMKEREKGAKGTEERGERMSEETTRSQRE